MFGIIRHYREKAEEIGCAVTVPLCADELLVLERALFQAEWYIGGIPVDQPLPKEDAHLQGWVTPNKRFGEPRSSTNSLE